ncbi:MAG TPA: hypothetical protein VN673_06070, partial [Clostridia bacterium]|nr:hypothetical protein [Clostridia bacterium]
MNALQTKEFRLLLPSWGAALVLAAASGLLMEAEASSRPFATALLLFGALLLALTTFGAEFSFQTFSLVLSQPLQRARIWRTKIAALVFTMVTTLLLWGLVVYWKVDPDAHTFWREIVPVGVMGTAVAFTGGLWST